MTTEPPTSPAAARPPTTPAAAPAPPPTWLALAIELAPLVALAIVTVLLAWVYAPLFRGELSGDDNTFHFAEVARIAGAVRAGDWDWWSPAANGGFATGYYYQLVPAAVPGLLAGVFGHPLFWFQLGVFVPLVLVPVAAYRGLRVMGATSWPALAGALALAFCSSPSKWGGGVNGVFLVGLYTQAWALCALPLALGHGARWLARGQGLAPAVVWGAVVGLCHPVAGLALGAALTAAIAPLAVATRPRWAPPARLAALGVALLVASAAAWLPVLVDYAGFGGFPARVKGEDGPGFGGLARWLVHGYLFDAWRWPLLSIGLMLAVPAALAATWRRPYLAWLAVATLALGFVLGVGRSLKTQDDLFPAVRFLGPLQVTAALVVGAALAEGALWLVRWSERQPLAAAIQAVVGAAATVAAAGLIVPVLGAMHARVRVSTDYPAIHRKELDLLLPVIRAAGPGRIQVRGVENHWFMMLPYVYADRPALAAFGGAALQSSPNFVYLQAGPDATRAAWIFDAPLVLTNHERGKGVGGELLKETAHHELRLLPSPGLVSPVQVTGELPAGRKAMRKAALRWQASDEPMAGHVLAHHGHGTAGPPPDGDVLRSWRSGSWLGAYVDVRTTTTFVIRESWHPRWRATVDGRPAALRRVSPDMLAVDVGPGVHRLDLHFARPLWTWLLWLLIPLVAAIEPGLRMWRRRRAAPPVPPAVARERPREATP